VYALLGGAVVCQFLCLCFEIEEAVGALELLMALVDVQHESVDTGGDVVKVFVAVGAREPFMRVLKVFFAPCGSIGVHGGIAPRIRTVACLRVLAGGGVLRKQVVPLYPFQAFGTRREAVIQCHVLYHLCLMNVYQAPGVGARRGRALDHMAHKVIVTLEGGGALGALGKAVECAQVVSHVHRCH